MRLSLRALGVAACALAALAAAPAHAYLNGGVPAGAMTIGFHVDNGGDHVVADCHYSPHLATSNAAFWSQFNTSASVTSTTHNTAPSITVQCQVAPSSWTIGGTSNGNWTPSYTYVGAWGTPQGLCLTVSVSWNAQQYLFGSKCTDGFTVSNDIGRIRADAGIGRTVNGGPQVVNDCYADPTKCPAGVRGLVDGLTGTNQHPIADGEAGVAGLRVTASTEDPQVACAHGDVGVDVCAP